MRKIEIDNKNSHNRNNVISGFGPNKILAMQVKQALEKSISPCDECSDKVACDSCEHFVWDVFDINYHTWRYQ